MDNRILYVVAAILATALACSPPPMRPAVGASVSATETQVTPTEQLTPTPTPQAWAHPTQRVLTTRAGETWNMRQYPGTTSRIIAVLPAGTACAVIEQDDWILARCEGLTGWVNAGAFGIDEIDR